MSDRPPLAVRPQDLGWMPLDDLLSTWRVGSGEWSWLEEAAQLIEQDPSGLASLLRSVDRQGLRAPLEDEEPITLGSDGRIWGGHHRIVAAILARTLLVPVVHPGASW